ncbi:DsbA family protein [Crossiella sp. SN42]|uniref:mycothiol-dependent nitroreductase Rv2466c family protein n=1 Tax=Crossiella sp. SN42 TaxID=2944808 RepID=UPI00207C2D8B|nr:DsbA family protein [Crossiella sp. SN42]MCO1580658.1 DsbA family protein [Crossiella sp. SN42]
MAETDVDFWFDPSCPYTWVTARWLTEVARVRPITLRYHVMSLSVLNEHLEVDPEGDTGGYLWMPVRVCAAVERQHGQDGLRRFFAAYGARVHEHGDWDFATALTEAGLPADLAGAAGDESYDAAVRASHERGISLVGKHVGTPIIAAQGTAFFGPVISTAPRGEAAGRLWDGALLVAGTPGFHELKGIPHLPPDFT